MNNIIKNFIYVGLVSMVSFVSEAGDRRICWLQTSEYWEEFSDFYIDSLKGESAQINGQTCINTADFECAPGTGVMTADKGKIEISLTTSHSWQYPEESPQYGLVTTTTLAHVDIDPISLSGTSTLFVRHISSISKEVVAENYTGSVKIIDCPKTTIEDKDNMKTLRGFINRADNYK